jgi:hypothetical protein
MARQYAEPDDRPPPPAAPPPLPPVEPRPSGDAALPETESRFGRAEEDRLDALENASASPAQRRKRDALFLLVNLLLTAILVAIVVMAVRHHHHR